MELVIDWSIINRFLILSAKDYLKLRRVCKALKEKLDSEDFAKKILLGEMFAKQFFSTAAREIITYHPVIPAFPPLNVLEPKIAPLESSESTEPEISLAVSVEPAEQETVELSRALSQLSYEDVRWTENIKLSHDRSTWSRRPVTPLTRFWEMMKQCRHLYVFY